jgi:hypothetical protein
MRYVAGMVLFMSLSAQATLTVGECPVHFEGRVEEIIESSEADHAYKTQHVVFKNLLTLKGDVPEQVSVEVLKHGPVQFESGEDYRIQTRAGRLCSVESL